jgi:hypothetical protein
MQPAGIRRIERAARGIDVRLLRRRQQRVDRQELLSRGVVVAGAQVVEARLAVLVLPGIAERVGDAARAAAGLAVGVIGVGY